MTGRRVLDPSETQHRVRRRSRLRDGQEGAASLRQLWRPVLNGSPPTTPASPSKRSERARPHELVRLSANENPLGPSPRVVEAVRREAARVHLYPDGGSTGLRAALGRRLGVAPAQIVVGNGADELHRRWSRWPPSSPATRSWCPTPVVRAVRDVASRWPARGCAPSPLAGYETDLDDVRRRVHAAHQGRHPVLAAQPGHDHHPPGAAACVCWRRCGDDPPLVVLDEAYCDFCDDPEYPDGDRAARPLPAPARAAHVLEDRRPGRAAGGLRHRQPRSRSTGSTGCARPTTSTGSARSAALAALDDPEHRERTRQLVLEERAFLGRRAEPARVHLPALAGQLLPGEGAGRHAPCASACSRAGLVVRDGAAVGFPDHLRISIGTHAANERLLGVLDDA